MAPQKSVIKYSPHHAHHDSVLEGYIAKKDRELKAEARKYGDIFGRGNRPLPDEENILPYISIFKGGYEELERYCLQYLQPNAHSAERQSKYYW